jgi:hypothetical protein
MKFTIDMCFVLLLHTLINASFTLVISCEGLIFLPLTSKGVYKIVIHNLIIQQQGCILSS